MHFPCLSQAWDPVVRTKFKFEKSESTPEFIDIASPKDVVFAARFRITLEGRYGEFHVTMPYSMLELVKQGFRDLRPNTEAADKDWPKELHAAVYEINVELIGGLVETELTLGEIINLKQGDVITVSIPEQVCLRAGRVALFTGVYGQNKGHNSVRITEKLSGSSTTTKWKDSNAEKRLQ